MANDSVASLVTAGTVPASRPLAPATGIPFAAARPAFGNRYFARFPPPWLYAPARPSHHADAVLRPLGLPQALRLALPWLIAGIGYSLRETALLDLRHVANDFHPAKGFFQARACIIDGLNHYFSTQKSRVSSFVQNTTKLT